MNRTLSYHVRMFSRIYASQISKEHSFHSSGQQMISLTILQVVIFVVQDMCCLENTFGYDRTEQSRTEQSRAEQNRTEHLGFLKLEEDEWQLELRIIITFSMIFSIEKTAFISLNNTLYNRISWYWFMIQQIILAWREHGS